MKKIRAARVLSTKVSKASENWKSPDCETIRTAPNHGDLARRYLHPQMEGLAP